MTLLGLIIVLSNLSAANQMGHHVAVTLPGFLYGFVVAIFICTSSTCHLPAAGRRRRRRPAAHAEPNFLHQSRMAS